MTLHHVELWVPDLARAHLSWGWLLRELGWAPGQHWEGGFTWTLGPTYVVFEQSKALLGDVHERTRPGLNHLAFHAGPRSTVDRLTEESAAHGWSLLIAEQHPHARRPEDFAAYLEDADGYEAELVAG